MFPHERSARYLGGVRSALRSAGFTDRRRAGTARPHVRTKHNKQQVAIKHAKHARSITYEPIIFAIITPTFTPNTILTMKLFLSLALVSGACAFAPQAGVSSLLCLAWGPC